MYHFHNNLQYFRTYPQHPQDHIRNFREARDTRAKPTIHISYIGPQSPKVMDSIKKLYELDPTGFLMTIFTKSVEGNPRNYFTFRENCRCEVDKIAYNELANRHSVTGLSFHLIGHGFPKTDGRYDFSIYAKVRDVDFDGHFSYVTPAFQIMSQLKSLKKVTFTVGQNQHPFFLEDEDEDYKDFSVEPNPSVETLVVRVKNKIFLNGSKAEKENILKILELIFLRAGTCFPNLVQLDLDLPASEMTKNVFEKVVNNSRFVSGNLQLELDVMASIAMMTLHFGLTQENPEDRPERPILGEPKEPFTCTLDKTHEDYQFETDLQSLHERIGRVHTLLTNLKECGIIQKLMSQEVVSIHPFYPEVSVHPPPGFEHWFTKMRVSIIRRNLIKDFRMSSSAAEIDRILSSIVVNQEAIQRNQERLRWMLNQDTFDSFPVNMRPTRGPIIWE